MPAGPSSQGVPLVKLDVVVVLDVGAGRAQVEPLGPGLHLLGDRPVEGFDTGRSDLAKKILKFNKEIFKPWGNIQTPTSTVSDACYLSLLVCEKTVPRDFR